MILNRKYAPRSAATAVEFAVVGVITFFLVFALCVGAMGVFRYQEVAHLAREGSRYASVHGGQYHLDGIDSQTGVPQVVSTADLVPIIQGRAVVLDPSLLTVSVSWSVPGYSPPNMPFYDDTDPNLIPPGQIALLNYVTVTVTYQWTPVLYLTGPITLTSTSTVQVNY